MAYTPKYIDPAAFTLRVSPQVLIDICDDDEDGTADPAVILAFIEDGEGLVDSWILPIYDLPLTNPNDRLCRTAAVLYTKALIFERHEEYVRSGQAERVFQRAEGIMKRVREALRRLPDQPAPPEPANVGGGVSSVEGDLEFPCPPKPTFGGGMGDF